MIDFDRTAPLRRKAQLLELIEAVVEAEPVDEAEWIEWKSRLDLRGNAGQFSVGKAVLGIANRLPDEAAQWFGGYGYVLVGVQPAGVVGVDAVDQAVLRPGVDAYTGGGDGPRWSPEWLRTDGGMVLVVVVDPPRWGDRIWALRRTYGAKDGGRLGTVFVRRGSETAPVTDAQLAQLERRSRERAPSPLSLQVAAVGGPLAWFDPADVRAQIEAVVEQAVTGERETSRAVLEGPPPDPRDPMVGGDPRRTIEEMLEATTEHFAQQMAGVWKDRRSWPQYEEQLGQWAKSLRAALIIRFVHDYHDAGNGRLDVVVTNPTGRHLHDVEFTVELPPGVIAFADVPEASDEIPSPPLRWGRDVVNLSFDLESDLASKWSRFRPPFVGQHFAVTDPYEPEITEGRVVFPMGSLRQRDHVGARPVWLQLRSDEPIDVRWTVRSPDLDDAVEGSLQLDVASAPVAAADLVTTPVATATPGSDE